MVLGCLGGCLFWRPQHGQRSLSGGRETDEVVAAQSIVSRSDLSKSTTLVNRKNALHLAAEEGHLVVLAAVLETLICQLSSGTIDADGGAGECLKDILDGQDANGQTPLHIACSHGHADCARFLLANGADRCRADSRGDLPLHLAAARGYLGVMLMLLTEFVPQEAADMPRFVDARNNAGFTPLHFAVWGKYSAAVQILVQHGADIGARNTQPSAEQLPCPGNSTPLHLAAARGHVEISRILLKTYFERVLEPLILAQRGGQPLPLAPANDPRAQYNASGHMPYQVAQRNGFFSLAMMLRPTIPITRLFSEEERNSGRIYGPPALKVIAAEAANRKLVATLAALADPIPAPASTPRQQQHQQHQQPASDAAPSSSSSQQQQQQQQEAAPLRRLRSQTTAALLVDATDPSPARSASPALVSTSPRVMSPTGIPLSPAGPPTPGGSVVRTNSASLGAGSVPGSARRTLAPALLLQGLQQEDVEEVPQLQPPATLPGLASTQEEGEEGAAASGSAGSGPPVPAAPGASPRLAALHSPGTDASALSPSALSPMGFVMPSTPHAEETLPESARVSLTLRMLAMSSPGISTAVDGSAAGGDVAEPARPATARAAETPSGAEGSSIARGDLAERVKLPPSSPPQGQRRDASAAGGGVSGDRPGTADGVAAGVGTSGQARPDAAHGGDERVGSVAEAGGAAEGAPQGLAQGQAAGGNEDELQPTTPSFCRAASASAREGADTASSSSSSRAVSVAGMTAGGGASRETEGPAAAATGAEAAGAGKEASAAGQRAEGVPQLSRSGSCSTCEDECGVCMERSAGVAIKPCGHHICGPCAHKVCSLHLQKPSLCPFCRALINDFARVPPAT